MKGWISQAAAPVSQGRNGEGSFNMPRHSTPEIYLHEQPMASSYDVVIIGGGGHGLATAYYLAREHGVRKVACPLAIAAVFVSTLF